MNVSTESSSSGSLTLNIATASIPASADNVKFPCIIGGEFPKIKVGRNKNDGGVVVNNIT